jgi:hypothetical protein
MSGWLGSNSRSVTRYTGLNVQTSALNIPIPLVGGQRRLAWNLIWQADFTSKKQKSGKGGGKGSESFTYSVAVIMALCRGVVTAIGTVWQNQSTTTMAKVGLSLMGGTALQTAWSYVTAKHPSQALSYANTAYIYTSALQLGSTPAIPQIDVEATCLFSGTMPGTPDINLGDWIPFILTDPLDGLGFSVADINNDDLAFYKNYQQAQGLFFSPALISQEKATDIIDRYARLSNSWIFFSGSQLRFVPLGDSFISANGTTYTPITTIRYDLTVKNFLGDPPVKVSRIRPADAPNRTVIQITDRALGYNSNPLEYKDQTLLDQYGPRDNTNIQADEICDAVVGQIVVDLIGQRAPTSATSTASRCPTPSCAWSRRPRHPDRSEQRGPDPAAGADQDRGRGRRLQPRLHRRGVLRRGHDRHAVELRAAARRAQHLQSRGRPGQRQHTLRTGAQFGPDRRRGPGVDRGLRRGELGRGAGLPQLRQRHLHAGRDGVLQGAPGRAHRRPRQPRRPRHHQHPGGRPDPEPGRARPGHPRRRRRLPHPGLRLRPGLGQRAGRLGRDRRLRRRRLDRDLRRQPDLPAPRALRHERRRPLDQRPGSRASTSARPTPPSSSTTFRPPTSAA